MFLLMGEESIPMGTESLSRKLPAGQSSQFDPLDPHPGPAFCLSGLWQLIHCQNVVQEM